MIWVNADAFTGPDGVNMNAAHKVKVNSSRRLAHAKELHVEADAARERSAERKQVAKQARSIAEQLRGEAVKASAEAFSRARSESVLEMAERHVAEADRHVEHQRQLIEVLIRDKHERMLEHARKVLELLEQSRKLARAHLALEREFHRSRG